MANHRNRFPARRRFLKQSTALTAATMVALPQLAGAKPAPAQDGAAPSEGEAHGHDRAAQTRAAAPVRGQGRTRGPKR